MSEARKIRTPRRPPARLANVTLLSRALGHAVTVGLDATRTILVGLNGAGKSLLIEALYEAATVAVRRTNRLPGYSDVKSFNCEIGGGSDKLTYRFQQSYRQRGPDDDPVSAPVVDWEESCHRSSRTTPLWHVKDGIAKLGQQEVKLERGAGLLGVSLPESVRAPSELNVVRDVLSRVRRVQSGVPRTRDHRGPIFLTRASQGAAPSERPSFWTARHEGRLEFVCRLIMNWHDFDRERFAEYVEIGRRIGLWRSLSVGITRQGLRFGAESQVQDLGYMIADDDIDFASLSDGTLRTAEILCHLIAPMTTVLLIEEPETAIHPGLLQRLLSELEAYSLDKQIVLSTHSPYVVSRAGANEIRLVRRSGGQTNVTTLSSQQLSRLQTYLTHDGTLGEFVFSGATEDE